MSAPALSTYNNGLNQVSGDNLNTFAQTCDSYAEMKAFIGVSGVQVFMRGFVSPNDGGQGFFYWNASGIAADDGGVTTIVPNGVVAGEWTRISNSSIGNGTVTSVSVVTANGISGAITNPSTVPAITLSLGAITPSSVAATGTVTGSNLTGTNTGDQTITLTGPITGSGTGSITTAITNNSIGLTALAQIAGNSVLGNANGSTGSITSLQNPSVRSISVTGSSPNTNGIYLPTTNTLGFSTNGVGVGAFDSVGRFLIGETAPLTGPGVAIPYFQQVGVVRDSSTISAWCFNSSNAGWGAINLMTSRGSAVGTNTALQHNDTVGTLNFIGADGTSYDFSAWIECDVDSTTISNGILPGRLDFYTSNTSGNGIRALRLDSKQNVTVGTAAIATTATSGFLWFPSCAGAPTGVVTAPYTNATPIIVDTTNSKIWVNIGGTWKGVTVS